MFDFLKKKIGGFIDNLTKSEGEEKAPEKAETDVGEAVPESSAIGEGKVQSEEIQSEEKTAEEIPDEEISSDERIPEEVPSEENEDKETLDEEIAIEDTRSQKISEEEEVPEEENPGIGEEPEPEESRPERARTGPEIDFARLEEAKREAADILAKEAVPEPHRQEEQRPVKNASTIATMEKQPSWDHAAKTTVHESKPTKKEIPRSEISPGKSPEKKIHQKKTGEVKPERQTHPESGEERKVKEKERVKVGVFGAIKGLVTGEIEISESDVSTLLDDLELELLEADVDLTVANIIREELKSKLSRAKVKRGELHKHVGSVIRETLIDILTNERDFDLVDRAKGSEKPFKIVFLGINGAGKTTTIAKVARLLMDNGLRINFAAADTFRAAAIEQLSTHGERLNVRVVKRDYGSDPTSVAFDAVNYAKAHSIDAVLIDTAGRQDTNISLINEMKKMDRVIKPDLKIYIGESISGNAIIEQISSFNREIGIDGVILTKLDCDPKGGTMLSISKATGIPILYLGVGQAYTDLERFDPEKIAERITS